MNASGLRRVGMTGGVVAAVLLASFLMCKLLRVKPDEFWRDMSSCALFLFAVGGKLGLAVAEGRRHSRAEAARKQAMRPVQHIVGRGEYVVKTGEKVALSVMGGGMSALAYVGLAVSFLMTLLCGALLLSGSQDVNVAAVVGGDIVIGGGSLALLRFRRHAFAQAEAIDPGVPITQANISDLPANDTLVRASQEPASQQQATLLRPATEARDRHEEQLLRVANEQSEKDA